PVLHPLVGPGPAGAAGLADAHQHPEALQQADQSRRVRRRHEGTQVKQAAPTASPRVGRPGIAWAVPGVLFFVLFAVGPMALVVYLSFTSWDGLGAFPSVSGTGNWERLFDDPTMRQAVW